MFRLGNSYIKVFYVYAFLVALIVILVCILYSRLVSEYYICLRKKHMRKYAKMVKLLGSSVGASTLLAEKRSRVKNLSETFKKFKIFGFSEKRMHEINDAIAILGLKDSDGLQKLPEEFFISRCVTSIILIGVCIGLSVITPLTLVLIPVAIVAGNIAYSNVLSERKRIMQCIDKQMPTFISGLYHTFCRDVTSIDLLPFLKESRYAADKNLLHMINTLQIDIENLGNVRALKNLREYYGASSYVRDFCNVTTALACYETNAKVPLIKLYESVKQEQKRNLLKTQEKIKTKRNRCVNVCLFAVLILLVLCAISV